MWCSGLTPASTFLKRMTLSLLIWYLVKTSALEEIPKGMSSTASAARRNSFAASDVESWRVKKGVSEGPHHLKHSHPRAQPKKLEDQVRQDSKYCIRHRGFPSQEEAGKALDTHKSISSGNTNSTLKKPITTTSLESTRASAAATSGRVAAAGPVRFLSQLTMSSASLPAAQETTRSHFPPQQSPRAQKPQALIEKTFQQLSQGTSRTQDIIYATPSLSLTV